MKTSNISNGGGNNEGVCSQIFQTTKIVNTVAKTTSQTKTKKKKDPAAEVQQKQTCENREEESKVGSGVIVNKSDPMTLIVHRNKLKFLDVQVPAKARCFNTKVYRFKKSFNSISWWAGHLTDQFADIKTKIRNLKSHSQEISDILF